MTERTQSSREMLPSKILILDDKNNETTCPSSVASYENGIEDHINESSHHDVHHILLREKILLDAPWQIVPPEDKPNVTPVQRQYKFEVDTKSKYPS
eukprot:56478-Ditylum_brightwellii.AAC.1